MGHCKNPRNNCEGYNDPTTYEAIRRVDKDHDKFVKVLDSIQYECQRAGFEIQGRIILKDKNSGKVWR